MSEPLLSIICPVYNCEAYLGDLVQAMVAYANDARMEWIFVHDCATDRSEETLRTGLAARAGEIESAVIHLVHDQNKGLAAARNTGIRVARGSYVGFIDSDDIPMAGFATYVLGALGKHEPQVLEIGYEEFVDAAPLLRRSSTMQESIAVEKLDAGNQFRLLFENNFFAWTRIVKREFFAHVMFMENRLTYEDIPYSMALFCEATAVHHMNLPLIGYRKRPGSITSTRDQRFLDQYTQLRNAIQIYRQHPQVPHLPNFEWRLFRKLTIMLLKGIKINSGPARRQFFQAVYEDLRAPHSPFKQPANGVGRVLARLLASPLFALG